jgi:hypothetical protein
MKLVTLSAVALVLSSFSVAAQAQNHAPNMPAAPKNAPAEPPSPAAKETGTKEAGGSVIISKARFVSPKDGDTVSQEFPVKFSVEGMKAKKAGEVEPGTGHFHLTIDGDVVSRGQVIPKDEKHIHYGQGETEAKVKLPPGKHTLTVQFADGAHRSYGEIMAQTITVTVK